MTYFTWSAAFFILLYKTQITPEPGKERGDIEIKDYVVLQKPQGQDNLLPPPRTLIMDFTMTHVRFGRSHVHPIGQLMHTRCSDGTPDPDGVLKEEVRIKIRHYQNIYLNRPDPIAPLPSSFFLRVLPKGHMLGVYFSVSLSFLFIIVLS